MNDQHIEPGAYKLTQDVSNPNADRRYKDDWRYMPVWPAGSEFIVEISSSADSEDKEVTYETIMMVGARYDHYSIGRGQAESFRALKQSLIPCFASDEAFLMMTCGSRPGAFARWLLESGRLSRDLFAELWGQYMDNGQTPASEPVVQGTPLIPSPDSRSGYESDDELDLRDGLPLDDPDPAPVPASPGSLSSGRTLIARATELVQSLGATESFGCEAAKYAVQDLADLVHELAMRVDRSLES